MRAVQLGDHERVKQELRKYEFPRALREYALLRATLLGHAAVVLAMIDHGRTDPNCSLVTGAAHVRA
jgi:hypothetical protein